MQQILQKIVQEPVLHAKWLNSLSFMENTGARKISACENAETADIIQLKHAAEEHRHAYYLKKQILKLPVEGFTYYRNADLLAPNHTKQYLHKLDVECSRYIKKVFSLANHDLKYAAYLFVTYAIEVRADELYPAYQEVLTANDSRVMVKSIIVEEEGHLEEMMAQLDRFDDNWKEHAARVSEIEDRLFREWFAAVSDETLKSAHHTEILT